MKEYWKATCSLPQLMKGEGFGKFEIFKVECSSPLNYRGPDQNIEYYQVRDKTNYKTILKTFPNIQEARNFAGEQFKKLDNENTD